MLNVYVNYFVLNNNILFQGVGTEAHPVWNHRERGGEGWGWGGGGQGGCW